MAKHWGCPFPEQVPLFGGKRKLIRTIYFGIPMGGWKPNGEPFLENNQLEPDIRVPNEPGAMAAGRDQQIEAAVKELLK